MSVFVLGALHLDVILSAPHLPREDETVTGSAVRYAIGGKGGNQALAAARHGAVAAMAGRVGDDRFGAELLEGLSRGGVDRSQVQRGTGPSGMSAAIVQSDGSYGAVIVSGANLEIEAGRVRLPQDARVVLLQNEVPEAVNLSLAQEAQARGVPVILNAAPYRAMSDALLGTVSTLVVNRIEAEQMSGRKIPDVAAAEEVAAGLAGTEVLLTLGAEGVVRATQDGTGHHPAHPVTQRATHGAGDAFVGALAARRAQGLADGLAYAQAAAALHVSRADPDRITPEEVLRLMGST